MKIVIKKIEQDSKDKIHSEVDALFKNQFMPKAKWREEVKGLVSAYGVAAEYVLSKPDYASRECDSLGNTLAHYIAEMENPRPIMWIVNAASQVDDAAKVDNAIKVWSAKNADGWSVGHLAVKEHKEVAEEVFKLDEVIRKRMLSVSRDNPDGSVRTILDIAYETHGTYLYGSSARQNMEDMLKSAKSQDAGLDSVKSVMRTEKSSKPESRNNSDETKIISIVKPPKKHKTDVVRKEEIDPLNIDKWLDDDREKELVENIEGDTNYALMLFHSSAIFGKSIKLDTKIVSTGKTLLHEIVHASKEATMEIFSMDPVKAKELLSYVGSNNMSVAELAVAHYRDVAHIVYSKPQLYDITCNGGQEYQGGYLFEVAFDMHPSSAPYIIKHRNEIRNAFKSELNRANAVIDAAAKKVMWALDVKKGVIVETDDAKLDLVKRIIDTSLKLGLLKKP